MNEEAPMPDPRTRSPAPWLHPLPAALLALTLAAPGPADAAADQRILVAGSYWRVSSMRAAGIVAGGRDDPAKGRGIDSWMVTSPPPPTGWTAVAFDDAAWPRVQGPMTGGYVGWANKYSRLGRSLICLRGKFAVSEVAAVADLWLSLRYAGGVVAYVNGREVYRGHLPGGPVDPTTPAEAYPPGAYVDARGRPIPAPNDVARRVKAGEADLVRRVGLRTARESGPVKLPVTLLVKGVNVLAVELHRSAFSPQAARPKTNPWAHIGLLELALTAKAPDGAIAPNVARPKGIQAWVHDPFRPVGVGTFGDPNEPLGPVRLTGVRNGHFSGQVVLACPRAIAGVKAAVTDLKCSTGGVIPAERVRVRYAAVGGPRQRTHVLGPGYKGQAFAALLDRPPAEVKPITARFSRRDRAPAGLAADATPMAVQPVWLTVHVPDDAKAGRYRGAVTVRAEAIDPVTVPVELTVIDWTLPPTRDFDTFVAVNQSPETLAKQYKAALWSPLHLAALDRSWRLLGYVGNNLLVVPLVNWTQYGNDECLVPWVRKADGSYTYDFTGYDALVAAAVKHCRVRVIAYQVNLSTGWSPARPDKPVSVTVVDAATGDRRAMKLPAYNTAEARKLWRPLLAALRERNARLALGKDVLIVLGIGQDGGVHKDVVAHFKELMPGVRWHYGAHNRPRGPRKDFYGFSEYLYVPTLTAWTGQGERRYGWRQDPLVVMSQRVHDNHQYAITVRTMAERALLLGDSGPGRMCLDYWPVEGARAGAHGGSLYSRWPASSAGQRTPHLKRLALPGPRGAVATPKLEAFREGLQEAQARVFIEKALAAGTVTGELARQCQATLDGRTAFCQATHRTPYSNHDAFWIAAGRPWQELSAELYSAAARLAHQPAEP